MRHLTKLLAGIIFVISAFGCASSQSVITDINGAPIPLLRMTTTPQIYEQWWREIAACEALPLPPEHRDVVWVVVPANEFKVSGDSLNRTFNALTMSPWVRIFINQSGLFNRGLVTHEQVHALLFWAYGQKYVTKHPEPYYSKCGLVEKGQQ